MTLLEIINAIEIESYGVFKDRQSARVFNKVTGEKLYLHRLRTILSLEDFKELYFCPHAEGAFLERCCGLGNVRIKVTKPIFPGIHGLIGPTSEERLLFKKFYHYSETNFWDNKILRDDMILTLDEIERNAFNPFKLVMVRNYGEVNQHNFEIFEQLFRKSSEQKIPVLI